MNLLVHLLSRIAMVAVMCLLTMAAFLLYQSHSQARQASEQIAVSMAKQLTAQLLLINAGIGQATGFPDFSYWKEAGRQVGVCIVYLETKTAKSHSLCNGSPIVEAEVPAVFSWLYTWVFNPGLSVVRQVIVHDKVYGVLTVSSQADLETAQAWNKTLSLLALCFVTVFSVCLLVFLSLRRALRPARIMVGHLKAMQAGNLAIRLPVFDLKEWQHIADAINRLADSQQKWLVERQKLLVKLMHIQEQERCHLARELHDEYGQCLAAINAVTSVIKQTAGQQYPDLLDEVDHISRITAYMHHCMRESLVRLRPPEFDELGLLTSLSHLIAVWNYRCVGKTVYLLKHDGDCELLSEDQAVALFRITQESLTNIAKHAQASKVEINLIIAADIAHLTIKDNGVALELPFANMNGLGLLGIRERLLALHGQLRLLIAQPHGLILEAQLPLSGLADNPSCLK